MFVINDKDLPITVAEKIIKGTKPISELYQKLGNNLVGGDGTEDMFSIDDIKEIADYLLVYYNSNFD